MGYNVNTFLCSLLSFFYIFKALILACFDCHADILTSAPLLRNLCFSSLNTASFTAFKCAIYFG